MPARLIYLLGVDGSGKSTIAEHLINILEAEDHRVYRVWATLHPVLLWPVIKVAKFLLVRKHNKFEDYSEHIKVKHNAVDRFRLLLKPLFYLSLVDYYPQYLWKVVWMSAKSDDLICDRYYIDMLMERAIIHGVPPECFPDWMRKYGRLFRSPDLAIYLRTSPKVAIARKTDIPSEEYLRERMLYYDTVAKLLRACIIDGDQPLSNVLAHVRECINAPDCEQDLLFT